MLVVATAHGSFGAKRQRKETPFFGFRLNQWLSGDKDVRIVKWKTEKMDVFDVVVRVAFFCAVGKVGKFRSGNLNNPF